MISIWWIRRDMRLNDNPALSAALKVSERVIPLFILDPALLGSAYSGEKRLAFMLGGVRELAEDLKGKGSRLVVRQGVPLDVLRDIINESGANKIFAEEDFSPYAIKRDNLIKKQLSLEIVGTPSVRHPMSVVKADGSSYTVFTPYSRAWKALPIPKILPVPFYIPSVDALESLPIPNSPVISDESMFMPGETQAWQRLMMFTSGSEAPIYRYHENRNLLDQATSGLSPYLRFGMVSARQAVHSAIKAIEMSKNEAERRGAETWLIELIWRDFYIQILFNFPFVRKESFRPEFRKISWLNNLDDYAAWCAGLTGMPVVDAAMRQLSLTGWMPNRARMIVASYLTKDLLVDWRWGEMWFMKHLLDGDPASNNGGWQWSAGTGTDAAPYFRIFNPVNQGIKFDPQGNYVRQWVKELTTVPVEFIHKPWEMPIEIQRKCGCLVEKNYPYPRVDHAWARERVLAAFRRVKA